MTFASQQFNVAAAAFDRMAATYDQDFTETPIGIAQRRVVHESLLHSFGKGQRILELNCGTGEDALLLGSRGIQVVACDASSEMIEVAQRKAQLRRSESSVKFLHIATEMADELEKLGAFDGAFSNFSGLNCVSDLEGVAKCLGRIVRNRGALILCVSTRVCLWELVWFAGHGKFRKAMRRLNGRASATLHGQVLTIDYPTLTHWKKLFAKDFALRRTKAIGLCVPPSYANNWMERHPKLLRCFEDCDKALCDLPILRLLGDHMLMEFERIA